MTNEFVQRFLQKLESMWYQSDHFHRQNSFGASDVSKSWTVDVNEMFATSTSSVILDLKEAETCASLSYSKGSFEMVEVEGT